ncbi:MAG: hypothetical protein KatS3mg109_0268 [Pirellulaceae bacterium]|nr:MAG: hypothetical protein KatS3mg109_0268 [Pirellulaceae bacterium]
MGKVSGELLHLIRKQIDDHGIVVWYDPETAYRRLVESLQLPDAQLLRFDGSFFQLRETLEPHLEWIDQRGTFKCDPEIPPRLLIYVPMNRGDSHDALVEAERAGVVMEPGAGHWMRNTRLKVLAERVFRHIAPR